MTKQAGRRIAVGMRYDRIESNRRNTGRIKSYSGRDLQGYCRFGKADCDIGGQGVILLGLSAIRNVVSNFNARGFPGCPAPVDEASYIIDDIVRPDVYAAMSGNIVMLAFGAGNQAGNILLFRLFPWKIKFEVENLLDLFRGSPYRYATFNALRNRYAAIVRKFGGETWAQEGRYFYRLDLWSLYGHFEGHG